MKIKINRFKRMVLLSVTVLGTMVACSESFLVDTNNQDLTSEVVFSSDDTALAAVTGVYDGFQNDSQGDPGLPGEYNVKGIHRWANSTGLDFLNNENPETSAYLNFNVDPSSNDVAVKVWPNNYRQIGRANIALENLYDVEKGRVSKATAYMLLGNANMWLGQYGAAVTAYEALEGSPVLDLEENFLDIHALANPNGKESIFELQWAANADLSWSRNDEVNILQLFAMPTDITGGGGFTGIPSKELYDAYEAGDTRRAATVIAPGEEHTDPLIDIINYDGVDINTIGTVADPWVGGSPDTRSGYWAIKSWRDPEIEGWGRNILFGGQGHIWMRYGTALLSLSEAALKDGNTAKAQAAFDRVRNRAWGGTAPAKTVTMDALLQEYRLETAGEFCTWGLIRRSGEATKFIQDNYGLTMPVERQLYPIPSSQLSANPNLVQNPGY